MSICRVVCTVSDSHGLPLIYFSYPLIKHIHISFFFFFYFFFINVTKACVGIPRQARSHYLWPREEGTHLSLKRDHYELFGGEI